MDQPVPAQGEKLSSNPWEMSWGDQPDYGPEPTGQQETAPVGKFPWEMEWGNRHVIEEPTGGPDSPQSTYIAPTNAEGFEGVFANLIQAESRGRHTNSRGQLTTSPVGARGITQIMPATGRNPGYGIKPLQNESQEEYLRVGREYLQAMLRQFNGNYAYAVAAYNAGEGNVRRAIARAERAGSSNWISFLPRPQETGPYVRKILGS